MPHSPDKDQLLEDLVVVDRRDPLPLHAQVHRALQRVIQEGFEHGDRFFNEEFLSARLGVSLATVRRALTDLASQGALERFPGKGTFVQKAAIPGQRTSHIGVFVPACEWSFEGTVIDRVLAALSNVCAEEGHVMDARFVHRNGVDAEQLWPSDAPYRTDGFVLLCHPPETTLELYDALSACGLASVNVDTEMNGYPGSYVGVNNALGMRLGMEHLLQLGHRRIALLVNEPLDRSSVQDRVEAFQWAAQKAGMEGARVVLCQQHPVYEEGNPTGLLYDGRIDDAIMDGLLHGASVPTAVFAVSDPGAWVVLKRLAERGVKVPEQMSVLGFGDEGPSRFVYPPLSTIALPYRQMAERAIALLLEPGDGPTVEHLPPALLVRESTGPAPPG